MKELKISYKRLCGELVSKELAGRYIIFLENNFYMPFSDFILFCDNKAKLQKAYSYVITHNGYSYLEFEICLFFADSEYILMIAEALNNFKILALNCFEEIIIKQTRMKFLRLSENTEHTNKEPETFLYLIKNLITNETKIGYAKNYKSRIRGIVSQGGIKKYKYIVFKGNKPEKIEKILHTMFRSKRKIGEWFALSDKDIFKIKSLMLNEYGFTLENDSIYQR